MSECLKGKRGQRHSKRATWVHKIITTGRHKFRFPQHYRQARSLTLKAPYFVANSSIIMADSTEDKKETKALPKRALESDSDGGDSTQARSATTSSAGEGCDGELSRLRRAKRLAMNRQSARARRKRKKVMIESLELQVAELAKRNQHYQVANDSLNSQVSQLERELAVARSTISLLQKESDSRAGSGTNLTQSVLGGGDYQSSSQHEAIRLLLQLQQQRAFGGLASGGYDDPLIRQQLQALSGRDSNFAGALGRFGPTSSLEQLGVNHLLSSGLYPQALQNTVSDVSLCTKPCQSTAVFEMLDEPLIYFSNLLPLYCYS
jgi:hypothetical protein